jgi:hypothetical protein
LRSGYVFGGHGSQMQGWQTRNMQNAHSSPAR